MKFESSVITVLQNCTINGSSLQLPAQLDRKLYEKVSKLLKSIGGKWTSSKKAFVFKEDVGDIISEIIASGEYVADKVLYQFFPTPDNLAKKIVAIADIRPDETCLEPSAGRGAIAKYMPAPDCVELNPENAAYLTENGFNVVGSDFMEFTPTKEYDVIVMNPPFCKSQDARHIRHAINIARRKVVAIASSAAMFRKDKPYTELRALVEKYGGSMSPIADGSFKDSGTMVKTCLIVVDKQ